LKKLITPMLLILFIIFSGSIFSQDSTGVEIEKINDNFYKFVLTTTYSVNMLVFTGPDGILLVDTGMPGISERIKPEIKKLSDKEIKYIINTHHHPDHFSGNQLLGKNAIKITHKNMYTALTTGLNILQEYSNEVLPQITFEEELDIYFNGEEIKLIAIPGTHSNSDIIVHFPKSNIVYLSAILTDGSFPFIGQADGGNINNYEKILDKILNTYNEETVFIIGHGQNCTKADIKKFKNMISETTKLVKEELAKGNTVEQLQQNNILKEWESWGQGFVNANLWIQTIENSINPPQQNNKDSIAISLFYTMKKKGVDAAILQYDQLRKDKSDVYDFREFNLNLFGYSLLGKNKFEDAIKILKLNVKMYPESANVYDSLGEAFERSGNKDKALANYKKAVQNAEKTDDPNLNIFRQNLARIQN
jgi:cyclase